MIIYKYNKNKLMLVNDMKKIVLYVILLIIVVIGVYNTFIHNNKEPIKIVTTSWVGYSSLCFADSKGWLKSSNIELVRTDSLSESAALFATQNVDAFVGTQYEYHNNKINYPNLSTLFLFDKSNGGDVIMSNMTISDLVKAPILHVYLEQDSINKIMFDKFVEIYKLDKKNIKFYNIDQKQSSNIKNNKNDAIIIVTYIPFNYDLEKSGFNIILSTKDRHDILVIDGLYVDKVFFENNRKEFIELIKHLNTANDVLNKNPREFYNQIKPYLKNTTYDEFITNMNDITILDSKNSTAIKNSLKNDKILFLDI